MSFPPRYRAPKNTFWSFWSYISETLDSIDSQFFWTMIENILQHLLHFELLLWKKGRNSLTLFQNLRNLISWIDDLVLDLHELRISISKSRKLREKRYSSSLKVVKERERKCLISQKLTSAPTPAKGGGGRKRNTRKRTFLLGRPDCRLLLSLVWEEFEAW